MTEFDNIIETFKKISLEDNKDNEKDMVLQVANNNGIFLNLN